MGYRFLVFRFACLFTVCASALGFAQLDRAPVIHPRNSSIEHRSSAAHAIVPSSTPTASGLNFASAVSYSSGGPYAHWVAVAEVNGDGKADLIVANGCPTSGNCTIPGTVTVLLGNGDGTFQTTGTYSTGGFGADSVVAADVNGDGKLDLVGQMNVRA